MAPAHVETGARVGGDRAGRAATVAPGDGGTVVSRRSGRISVVHGGDHTADSGTFAGTDGLEGCRQRSIRDICRTGNGDRCAARVGDGNTDRVGTFFAVAAGT